LDGPAGKTGLSTALRDPWIREGKAVNEAVRRTTRAAGQRATVGPIGRRSEAGRCRGEAEVAEDLPDDCRTLDDGDDLHPHAAAGTQKGIHFIDRSKESGRRRVTGSLAIGWGASQMRETALAEGISKALGNQAVGYQMVCGTSFTSKSRGRVG